MENRRLKRGHWIGMPPWIILGAVVILVPIFVFWTFNTLNKQKEHTSQLLLEKGAALIRSFEAGTRTGMMGMMGMGPEAFRLQKLLMETAQQPDIVYIIVTDAEGTIVAHSSPDRIGEDYGSELDLKRIVRYEKVEWRQIINPKGPGIFEVFRRFSPARVYFRGHRGMMRNRVWRGPPVSDPEQCIFVGLDMGPIEAARKDDARHTVLMAVILLLIGFTGIVSLFLAQAYRSARSSLTRIKVFSDTVVENMPIGLLAIDVQGRVISFNQTAEAVLQLPSAKALGEQANDILPPQLRTLINGLEKQKGITEREIDCTLLSGAVMPLEAIMSSLRADDGTLLGALILFRDLSELQELRKEVERNQRLASLGSLAAGIAHEIRNPLSSIKGFATYFKERYNDIPEDRKTAEIMVQEVERLNRVIGQLLEFARPVTIQKRSASLHAVIRHSLKMIERDALAKNIKVTANLAHEIDYVSIDPDGISQVLLNLYLNAIEAMEDGGTLSVELSRDENSRTAKIAVSDTGIGIEQEDLVHVFDPYFTTKQSGTGLGLAIVHKTIESHKGEVKVKSETGKGTTMTIVLPVSGAGSFASNDPQQNERGAG